ncbi:Uncharacterized protein DAT39_010178, partial [Clarias magur]
MAVDEGYFISVVKEGLLDRFVKKKDSNKDRDQVFYQIKRGDARDDLAKLPSRASRIASLSPDGRQAKKTTGAQLSQGSMATERAMWLRHDRAGQELPSFARLSPLLCSNHRSETLPEQGSIDLSQT